MFVMGRLCLLNYPVQVLICVHHKWKKKGLVMHLMTYKKGALPGLPLMSIYHKFPVGSMTARRWVQRNGYAGACQGLPVGHSIG